MHGRTNCSLHLHGLIQADDVELLRLRILKQNMFLWKASATDLICNPLHFKGIEAGAMHGSLRDLLLDKKISHVWRRHAGSGMSEALDAFDARTEMHWTDIPTHNGDPLIRIRDAQEPVLMERAVGLEMFLASAHGNPLRIAASRHEALVIAGTDAFYLDHVPACWASI